MLLLCVMLALVSTLITGLVCLFFVLTKASRTILLVVLRLIDGESKRSLMFLFGPQASPSEWYVVGVSFWKSADCYKSETLVRFQHTGYETSALKQLAV